MFWENVIISPLTDNKGNITNFVAVKEDITLRKHNEELIKLNEEKFRLVFDQSSEALLLTRPDGSIDAANPAACRMFQYSEEELIARGRNTLIDGNENSYDFHLKEQNTNGFTSAEFTFIKKGGERFLGEFSSSVFRDKDGVLRTSTIIRDITERKKMELELIKSKEIAEESNRLKSSFMANISHELRTPLTGILGYSELLTDEVEEEHKEMVLGIYRSGLRLLETIDSILDISRIEADKYIINYADFNLKDFISGEVQIYKNSATLKNLYLRINHFRDDIEINAGKNVVHTIISNLINNAIKFTDNGGITVSYKLTSINSTDNLIIEIEDTGIGISPENQALVFEEFRQVSEGFSRSFEGTGLGLSITKKLVDMLQGKIKLLSEPGKGSKFIVTLPVKIVKNNTQAETVSISNDKTNQYPDGKKRNKILIVENDTTSINLLKMFVKSEYDYDCAENGEDALPLIKENNYDLFLMDINLGMGIDGMEVTRYIRSLERYKTTPVIAVTAFAMPKDKEEFIAAGCNDYISKPFTREELLLKIKANTLIKSA